MTLTKPLFSEPLHVGRPNVGDRARLLRRINGVLDRRWLANNGPLVREFEARFAAMTQAEHCVAICNATTGIQVAAKAAGIRPGDEVIVPSFTSPATAHALDWIGAVPVFCDIDEESATADPRHVERLLGPRTRGIIGVHVFGHPCQIERLSELGERCRIPVLFDAAQAVGCTYQGRPLGGFGAAEIFSFHATKYVNSFEGGMIVTNDDEIAAHARTMRNLGLGDDRENVSAGTNARMNEGTAAMGLTSLEAMDEFIGVNKRNFELYQEGLADVRGVRVRRQAAGERANYQYVVIEVDAAVAGVDCPAVAAALLEHNVLSRRYFHPGCHQVEPYRSRPTLHAPLPLPHTEALSARVLSLPTGTAIGPAEIAGVCDIIRDTCFRA